MHNKGFFFLTLLLCLFSACRNQDGRAPTLSITSPADGTAFTADSIILVQGKAEDNKGLSQIGILLKDIHTGHIYAGDFYPLSGTLESFSVEFKLGDRYTPTGTYQLLVTAYDLSGNTESEEVTLPIVATPYVTQGIYWIGESMGNWTLFHADKEGNYLNSTAVADSVIDLDADAHYQSILVGARTPMSLRAYESLNLDLELNVHLGTGLQDLRCVYPYRDDYYCGFGNPPFLRVYDGDGLLVNNWDNLASPVHSIVRTSAEHTPVDDEYLVLSMGGEWGNPHLVSFYHPQLELIKGSTTYPWRTDALAPSYLGGAMAMGSENGQARLRFLDPFGEIGTDFDLAETPVDFSGDMDYAALLTDCCVHLVTDLASTQTLTPLATGNWNCVAYSRADRLIYLGGEDRIDVYDILGNFQYAIQGAFGTVEKIAVLHNK